MSPETKILQTKASVRVLGVVTYITGVTFFSVNSVFGISAHHRIWIVLTYVILGALWLADIFMTRIVLAADYIRIVCVTNFQSRTVPRAEIENVTWEKGCGAAIKLRNGKWVRLPNIGGNAQALANTIRGWLKRTKVSSDDDAA